MIPITTAALAWLASVASASQSKPHDAGEFNWKTISPSRDLHFSSCYDEFQCARLLVPVDWLDEDEAVRHKTMAIAIIKLAANITNPEQTHGGTMIINPGGPSDSGIVELLRNGHYLQDMIDSDHKRFEVMSFDPRGMAFSTPRGDCFQSEAARSLYDSQMLGTEYGGVKDLSDKELAKEFALERALGLQCSLPGAHGYVVQAYMSTASVARDMLHMVDKLDELEKETTTIATPPKGAQKPLGTGSGVPRLQYLGTSYGTFLGNTFASMFPGRVKRMILDGNIVPEDWLTNDWSNNIPDAGAVIDYFYQSCFDAKSKCAIWSKDDKSWHDIKAKITDVRNRLDAEPLPIYGKYTTPTILVGNHVAAALMDPIYAPLGRHEKIAEVLAQALQGNYTALATTLGLGLDVSDACEPVPDAAYPWMGLTNRAVNCGDKNDQRNMTFDEWRVLWQRVHDTNEDLGNMKPECVGWPIRPPFRFTGPFGTPEADANDVEGRPSAPVLFLTNRYDPVTPMRSAISASKAHAGSRVVVQNSVGHCATLASPSRCTTKIVRQYMDTGEMPAEGTVCDGDCIPFEDCPYPKADLPR